MTVVRESCSLARGAERLARTRAGPDVPVIGPAGETEGIAPDPDAGEEVALGVAVKVVGANISASVIGNSLLLYDRIFAVAKTMNSTATEAVTGVPTRFQSTTSTDENYIGGNFGFIEVGLTALAATAHNWTVCLYTDQAAASSTLPSLTGNSGAIVHRLDHPVQQWFAPLAAGDVGIKAWTQMQCSAAVATGLINFVIGHEIGFMSFPVINSVLPFDWLTNMCQAPYIPNDAYLAFLEINKPTTTATTYTGTLYTTSTAS